jgi:hypothetical protein
MTANEHSKLSQGAYAPGPQRVLASWPYWTSSWELRRSQERLGKFPGLADQFPGNRLCGYGVSREHCGRPRQRAMGHSQDTQDILVVPGRNAHMSSRPHIALG